MSIPTRRLIAATSGLDPANRAMLNLWLHRGLSDAEIATFIGATTEGVSARREALVETLARELEASPDEVRATVEQLGPREAPATGDAEEAEQPAGAFEAADEPEPPAEPEPAAEPPAEPEPESSAEPDSEPPAEPEPESFVSVPPPARTEAVDDRAPAVAEERSDRPTTDQPAVATASSGSEPRDPSAEPPGRARRRRLSVTVVAIAILGILALAVFLSLLFTGSDRSSSRPRSAAPPAAGSARPAPSPPRSPTERQGRPGGSARAPVALRPLPGARAGASGSATLLRRRTRPFLHVAIRGLPPPGRRRFYAAWLYNSVLDAKPLGIVAPGAFSADLALPTRYHHYRLVDVSLQRLGPRFHSGQSILRGPVP